MKYTIHFFACLFICQFTFSEAPADKLFSSCKLNLPVNANVSFLAKSPKSSTFNIDYCADAFRPPASTMKLVTALATRLTYSEQHVFTTQLETVGLDAVIRFSGDPGLQESDLLKLLIAYKTLYGSTIHGDLLLDASIFDGNELAEGITWENLSACYSAPSSGLTLNNNCVYAQIDSNLAIGKEAKVLLPSGQAMTASSHALIVSRDDDKRLACTLDAALTPVNHYSVSGCIAQADKPSVLKLSVQDTETYTKTRIASLLKKTNIQLVGTIRVQKVPTGKLVAAHNSLPIKALLSDMLLTSNNLTADHLFKLLGGQFFSQAGNFQNGAMAVKTILKERTHIDLSSASLADGSGLSRNNRLSAAQLMQVIEYIYHHDEKLNLLSMLPVSGISGTLQYRESMKTSPLIGRIRAKTGMIYSTYNMAGVIETKAGKPLLFVQMVTDYLPHDEKGNPVEQIDTGISRFEKGIYTGLINGHFSLNPLVKPFDHSEAPPVAMP